MSSRGSEYQEVPKPPSQPNLPTGPATSSRLVTMDTPNPQLFCGCGLRLSECLDPRLKDLEMERNMVIVRSGKRDRDERTVKQFLP